ncbi:hypothetical protein DOY81_001558 [Sarcophaga bullata]|nr:hypothetical protein DOY81_001558 [Sarcophaga bullata]
MCSMPVLCPLCAQTSFSSIDALRCSLIKAANGPLACPICHEMFLGLDKLTIHLFSHTNIMNAAVFTTTTSTSTTTSTTTNNNNNSSVTEAMPTSDTQNIKIKGKLKMKELKNLNKKLQTENLNSFNNNNINCNSVLRNSPKFEVNFEDSHLHQQHTQVENEKILLQKAKVTADIVTNNVNSSIQEQVVAVPRQQTDAKEIENLSTCDICEFTFRNEELRNMHIRLVHQNFDCHIACSSSSTSPINNSGIGHQTAMAEHEFKCHLCSKTFKMKGSLRVHLKVVHLMGLPYINNTPKLNICDRIRYKENKLLKSVNPTNTNTKNTSQADNILQNKPSSNLIDMQPLNFVSNLNSSPMASNINLINLNQPVDFQQTRMDNPTLQPPNVLLVFNTAPPQELANKVANNQTEATISTSPIDKDASVKLSSTVSGSLTENPKIWECDVCSKAFTTKYFLKKHKRLHTGEMPYTCELCARTFTFQQSYHKHLLYHSDEKPHVCSTCGRAFKELSTLHNHERIHSGEKPFKCEVCGKSFRQRVSFLVHTRIHTGVMPYKCEICQRSFRYKVSQRTHKCQPLSAEESLNDHDDTTIERMSENFIKEFLETSVAANQAEAHLNKSHNSPASNEIAAINEKSATLNEQQALLNKTIDDIVVESCNKLGIGGTGSTGFSSEHTTDEGSMSPSQRLQNMRLYSPQLVTPDLNGIDGDLTRFFLDNSQNGNNLL